MKEISKSPKTRHLVGKKPLFVYFCLTAFLLFVLALSNASADTTVTGTYSATFYYGDGNSEFLVFLTLTPTLLTHWPIIKRMTSVRLQPQRRLDYGDQVIPV